MDSGLSVVSPFVNRSTIAILFVIKLWGLTIWALISGRSFLIRRPGELPRLIARPWDHIACVFPLTSDDVHFIYTQTSINILSYQERRWDTWYHVDYRLNNPNSLNQAPPKRLVDLSHYRLVGQQLTQGFGVVGRGFCLALIEEYGRCPTGQNFIAGKVFLWGENELANGRIPINYFITSGVVEVQE